MPFASPIQPTREEVAIAATEAIQRMARRYDGNVITSESARIHTQTFYLFTVAKAQEKIVMQTIKTIYFRRYPEQTTKTDAACFSDMNKQQLGHYRALII